MEFGDTYTDAPLQNGPSFYFPLTRDALEYLGFEKAIVDRVAKGELSIKNLNLVVKYDKGKHGTFIGLGRK